MNSLNMEKYKKYNKKSVIWPLCVGALFLFSFFIGWNGFYEQIEKNKYAPLETEFCNQAYQFKNLSTSNKISKYIHSAHLSAQLFILQSGEFEKPLKVEGPLNSGNFQLHVARWTAPLSIAFATLLAVWSYVLSWVVYLRSRFYKNHFIVCGLGNKGLNLLKLYSNNGNKQIVVIEENPDHPQLDFARSLGAYVITADASNKEVLSNAMIHKARELFAVTNDDHTNINIAYACDEILSQNNDNFFVIFTRFTRIIPLVCHVHILDLRLKQYLDEKELIQRVNNLLDVRTFNIYETTAWQIVENLYPPHQQLRQHISILPEKFYSWKTENNLNDIIILGFGVVGENILKSIVRHCHYINGCKTRVTIVDKDVSNRMREFVSECLPDLCNIVGLGQQLSVTEDVTIQFIDVNLLQINNESYYDLGYNNEPAIVYVCLGDDNTGVSIAQKSRIILSRFCTEIFYNDIKFVVCIERPYNTSFSKHNRREADNMKIFPVDMISETMKWLTKAQVIDEVAKHIHSIWDESNKFLWESLPEEKRDSNRLAATHCLLKIQSLQIGFNMWQHLYSNKQIEKMVAAVDEKIKDQKTLLQLSKAEHLRWVGEQKMIGWVYHPDKKNSQKKTHPDIRPWDELSDSEQEKDRAIIKKLPELLKIYCSKHSVT